LILDEPTSALDLPSEAKLQQTFAGLRGRVGMLIVAHRLSTIVHCDRVLVLQEGRNRGFDRHHRLLETSPFYRHAVEISMIEPDRERVGLTLAADPGSVGLADGHGH
jgi:ABC-type multidrug transport system fused ATPase/permease subunit